jgi:acyl carrier protein
MTKGSAHVSLEESRNLVLSCLEEVLSEHEHPSNLVLGPETRLIGQKAVLDSLGLVTLIVDIEDRLQSDYGMSVTLADDRAMSRATSPFLTVESLAGYISSTVADGR